MPTQPASPVLREYQPTDRTWVRDTNVHHYVAVEGFDPSFAMAVCNVLDMLEARLEDEHSRFIIVEASDSRARVGCVFFSAEGARVGRIRLFYLDRAYRGQGVGRRMIEDVIAHGQERGFDAIRVSTFDRHAAACRLYRSLGFQEQNNEPALAFGQRMRQIDFEKLLPDHSR